MLWSCEIFYPSIPIAQLDYLKSKWLEILPVNGKMSKHFSIPYAYLHLVFWPSLSFLRQSNMLLRNIFFGTIK